MTPARSCPPPPARVQARPRYLATAERSNVVRLPGLKSTNPLHVVEQITSAVVLDDLMDRYGVTNETLGACVGGISDTLAAQLRTGQVGLKAAHIRLMPRRFQQRLSDALFVSPLSAEVKAKVDAILAAMGIPSPSHHSE